LLRHNITQILGTLGVLGGALGICCSLPAQLTSEVDAGFDAGVLDAGSVWVDAGPQPLPDLRLVASWDGGQADLELPDASVSPLAEFRFETSAVVADCRVRVLDDDERMVPNHAAFHRSDGGTLVDLSVSKPIPGKRCCRFVVDGEVGDLVAGSDHRLYQPHQARFSVWPQPAPPAGPTRRHRRHRRDR
jgi:hypothetical protein